ncbi:hypothetical protein BO94DRAFT_538996 [Aspergillus sclerotioniger CBS 115572]|uniref:C2H2-type domain-containing protein n=1 Tax=Aspergillus sclerotioniger CBS 115572 TaxID=1450535 RepID=A0A317VJT2_9EURO|nr:hypothetical protein BO94DRAFT_538996 [Aspergillus sclerotioniger CBS 115572]PWY73112.1 hypothetical protein BO94DRAFT_538996 [Aspergillus sclerotioniger CBS 115572]
MDQLHGYSMDSPLNIQQRPETTATNRIDPGLWLELMSANEGIPMADPNDSHSTPAPTMFTPIVGPSGSQVQVPGFQFPAYRAPVPFSPPLQDSGMFSSHDTIRASHVTAQDRQPPRTPPGPFQCKWEGCHYSGYFSREADLIRHLRMLHINPRAHRCWCGTVFNRRDNLQDHARRHHHHRHHG